VTATTGQRPDAAAIRFRPATDEDVPVCADIWRISINDYIVRLNQPEVPDDLSIIQRHYRHLRSTDPERFVVATQHDAGAPAGERIVGFTVATVRQRVWFLSMLFVLPDVQAQGLGRDLLRRVLPADGDGMALATATDSAQPISNALYALHGIVPRTPLLGLIGNVQRPEAFAALPSGVSAVPFEEIVARSNGDGHRRLAGTVDALDRELLGFEHPHDHRYLREQDRHGWLYLGPDGDALGYGYSSASGRVGPVLVQDKALLDPVLGHLLAAVEPRGAFISWIPGAADRALVPALRSGLRLEPFPLLLCWDRPPTDFDRYLPISPGLL
jgi:GNAT superfamily N-acetyltransferase